MSAVIEELKLKNFEGYKKGEVKFTDGLNLIKGRNSAGKSTLLYALFFALYGEVLGVHKKLLVSKLQSGGEMAVYIKFKNPINGSCLEVRRSGRLDKKGNYQTSQFMLHINGKEVEVESDEDLRRKVTENMGASLRKFVNLIYVRQGRLQDILEPHREDMDTILGITMLRELREQMDEVRKAFEKYEGRDVQTELQNLKTLIIPQLQTVLKGLNRDIGVLSREVKKLEDVIEKAESPQLLELLNYVGERSELEEGLKSLKSEFQTLLSQAEAKSRDEFIEFMEKMNEQQENLKKLRGELEDRVKKLQEDWGSCRGKASNLQEEINRHEKLLKEGISTCPTCGQDLKAETLQGMLDGKRLELQSLRREEEKSRKAYEEENENFQKLSINLITCNNKLENLNITGEKLQDCMIRKEKIENKIQDFNKLIEGGLKNLNLPFEVKDPELKVKVAQRFPIDPEQLENKKKEFEEKEEALKDKVSDRDRKKKDLEECEQKVGELGEKLEAAELARQLSERLEAAIETRRKDVLRRVEDKALLYYKRMTDQHDYDSIRIDPETYVVYIHPKYLVEYIPAMMDGGGHQTLLALAMRLALLEELRFRSLLILDEPTYGVDSENLPQLSDYLGEASRVVSQTILVTHHDICEEEASNIIEVGKGENGASHVQIKF